MATIELSDRNQGVSASIRDPISKSDVASKDQDQALRFLERMETNGQIAEFNINQIQRKVDWRIVPLMFLCYTMQFIDKVSLNYAAVMGLNTDLKLQGNDFSNAATALFIAYLVAEVPIGYILNKAPVAKVLGLSVILWGISAACMAAAKDYSDLLATRIFLGIFEAAIAPCLTLISSQWYTKSEQAPRFSFWYCGLGFGQIVGGAVSYGFQHVTHGSLAPWRIMFIFLGALTVIVGINVLIWLPDTPMTARFLTDMEKTAILYHVSENQTGIQNTRFKISHLLEALLDVQLWLLMLITILSCIPSGVVTTFSATLIRNIGFAPDTAALLNMPSGVVSIISTLTVGFGVRYLKSGHRWLWIVLACIPSIIGGGLMSFLPSGPRNANKAGLLAGIYMVNSIVAPLPIIFQWAASNIAGYTKRVFCISIIAGSFSIGNIVGPQTFQNKDAPQFIPAKITVMATQAACMAVTFVLFLYYYWTNSRRDKNASVMSNMETDGLWENLTDKENPSFRYVY